ncbi:MAG: glutathione S-transferase family protein [Pseudomonadales bacterium]
MITIFHLGMSQSDRIVWLMEELELPYELQWFDRGEDFLAQADYHALHPTATAPTIRDGELVLTESNAIVEYISHRHAAGKLSIAPEHANYPDYMYWMQLNHNLQSAFFVKMAAGDQTEENSSMMKAMNSRQSRYYSHLNNQLASNAFIIGDTLSCVDIMAMFPITMLSGMTGIDLADYPNVKAYVERLSARPAYQKAMSIAGPEAQRPL